MLMIFIPYSKVVINCLFITFPSS